MTEGVLLASLSNPLIAGIFLISPWASRDPCDVSLWRRRPIASQLFYLCVCRMWVWWVGSHSSYIFCIVLSVIEDVVSLEIFRHILVMICFSFSLQMQVRLIGRGWQLSNFPRFEYEADMIQFSSHPEFVKHQGGGGRRRRRVWWILVLPPSVPLGLYHLDRWPCVQLDSTSERLVSSDSAADKQLFH